MSVDRGSGGADSGPSFMLAPPMPSATSLPHQFACCSISALLWLPHPHPLWRHAWHLRSEVCPAEIPLPVHGCSCGSERDREAGREEEFGRTAEGSAAMGNAQEKPSGSGGGATPRRDNPRTHGAPGKEVANGAPRENRPAGGEEEPQQQPDSSGVDRSYLDAPAGALPPHLARLKNEGNYLFKNGQFGDALEKYTQAIDGCSEAGEKRFKSTQKTKNKQTKQQQLFSTLINCHN